MDFSDNLFFIQYTLENTMRRQWYLIQVDMQSTREVNVDFATNGEYWCVFLSRHPHDEKKSDTLCRWWPDWYMYSHCLKSNDIIYGDRILIRPSTIPCSSKFIQWSMLLPLYGKLAASLVGPFHFQPLTIDNRVRQRVHKTYWDLLV